MDPTDLGATREFLIQGLPGLMLVQRPQPDRQVARAAHRDPDDPRRQRSCWCSALAGCQWNAAGAGLTGRGSKGGLLWKVCMIEAQV